MKSVAWLAPMVVAGLWMAGCMDVHSEAGAAPVESVRALSGTVSASASRTSIEARLCNPANGGVSGGLGACRSSLASLSAAQLACVVDCSDLDGALAECVGVCTPTTNAATRAPPRENGALCSSFATCVGECEIAAGSTVGVCVTTGTGHVL